MIRVRVSGAVRSNDTKNGHAGGGTVKEQTAELEIELEAEAPLQELLGLALAALDSRLGDKLDEGESK